MDIKDFRRKKKLVEEVAKKHCWLYYSTDSKTYRISFKDNLSIYRIDIYLSKMTVVLLPSGDTPTYHKRQNIEMIDAIMKEPYKFE